MYPQITGAYTLPDILDLLHTWEFKTLSMLFVFYLACSKSHSEKAKKRCNNKEQKVSIQKVLTLLYGTTVVEGKI